MLESYIYRNLDRFGNCLISNSLYKRLGKEKILNDLKEHGFNCTLEKRKSIAQGKLKTYEDDVIIVEIIR